MHLGCWSQATNHNIANIRLDFYMSTFFATLAVLLRPRLSLCQPNPNWHVFQLPDLSQNVLLMLFQSQSSGWKHYLNPSSQNSLSSNTHELGPKPWWATVMWNGTLEREQKTKKVQNGHPLWLNSDMGWKREPEYTSIPTIPRFENGNPLCLWWA